MPKAGKKVKLGFNTKRLSAKSNAKSKYQVDFTNRLIRSTNLKKMTMQEEEFELEMEEEQEVEEEVVRELEKGGEEDEHSESDYFEELSIEMDADDEEDLSVSPKDADRSSSDLADSKLDIRLAHLNRPTILHRQTIMRRPTMKNKPDFLTSLGQIPDIDEISLSESITHDAQKQRRPDRAVKIEEKAEVKIAEIETFVDEEDLSTEFSEFDFLIAYSDEEELTSKSKEEDNFFEMMTTVKTVEFQPIDSELELRLDCLEVLKKDANAFLHSLINAVVEVVEYVDPKEVLRESLNKVHLFRELVRVLEEMYVESKATDFLNTKCVNHYRHTRDYRPLTPEFDELLPYEEAKYHKALDALNCLLGHESASKEKCTKSLTEAENKKAELEEQLKLVNARLETTFKKTLAVRHSKDVQVVIERGLQEMKGVRDHISHVRKILISREHVRGTLLEKMSRLQDVSDKLYLWEYETIIDQKTRLINKLAEKAERLTNIFHTFNSHTNIVAHVREKQSTFLHSIHSRQGALSAALTEKQNLRAYLHKLKLSRLKVKKQINAKHYEIGLLGKPALLKDYDETVEHKEQLQATVEGCKEEIKRLESKIQFLEQRQICT